MGQKGTQHHIEKDKSTFTLGASLMGQHNASRVRSAIGCWYTSLLPVLSCLSWEGNFVRCVLTGDTRLARAELRGEADIVECFRSGRLVMRVETRSTCAHTKRQRGCCSGRQYSYSGCVAVDPPARSVAGRVCLGVG